MIDHEDIQEALPSQDGAGEAVFFFFFLSFVFFFFFYLAPSLIFSHPCNEKQRKKHTVA